jgi:hypothetical protein
MNKENLINQINQNLSTWQIAEQSNTTQANVRYWLKKYNLQTIRTTNKENELKLCPKCNISKSKTEFYHSKKSSSYCKSCIVESNLQRQRDTKLLAVEYKGGKCSICGYSKCIAALDFHHTNPIEKDKNFFNMRGGLSVSLKSELDKCVLLCANCHREEHHLH